MMGRQPKPAQTDLQQSLFFCKNDLFFSLVIRLKV